MYPSYSSTLMDHFLHPRNAGRLVDATGIGQPVRFPTCGDTAKFHVKVQGGTITAATFLACGCGPVISAASVLTTLVIGRTVAEAAAITPEDVAAALEGVPRPKWHCLELVISGLAAALEDDRKRRLEAGGAAS